MNNKALELLIRSLDEELTAAEQQQLGQYLKESEALRKEKALLLKMRAGLADMKATAHPGFADQLIRELSQEQQPDQEKESQLFVIINHLFPKVAAACVIVVVLTVLATFLMEGSLSLEAFIGVQDLSPEDAYTLIDLQ